MKYHICTTDTNSETYTDGDQLNFTVNIDPSDELVKGSVAVTGKFKVLLAGEPLKGNEDLYIDPLTGAHSFFNMVSTQIDGGDIESINNYPRYARMFLEGNNLGTGMAFTSSSNRELRNGFESLNNANMLMGEEVYDDADTKYNGINNFCVNLLACFNRSFTNIAGAKVPSISVFTTLEKLTKIFYGTSNTVANDITYQLSDIKIMYCTQPVTVNPRDPIQFLTIKQSKTTIQSNNQNIILTPVGNLISISSSFIKQSDENNALLDNLTTEMLPGNLEIEFLFNGSQLSQKFPMKNLSEIMINYIQSLRFGDTKVSNCAYVDSSNEGFGCGLYLVNPINMKNSQISFKLKSGIEHTYSMYTYYTGLLQL